ncbi:MAG: PAS domain-containing protein, partial [Candidatus Jacksonbacteria bacterium]|nr:PAS domain-containing protein [Candidatus Jacksonbacteria bacterium]
KLETLENIISIMPGNVYWLNRDGVYLGCNDHQATLIGLASRKDIVGKRNVEIPGFLIPEVLDKYNQQVIEGGKSIVIEEPAVLPDGSDAVYLSTKVPLRNSQNEIVGIVGISIDITERKKIETELVSAKEKAEVANKAKKEFLYNMRHDIRTPFSGITGMATLLKTQETDEKKLQYINNIYTSSEELLDYLNTILELTQIEKGTIPVVSCLVDVKSLIQSSFNMFKSSIAAKKINFTFNYDESTSFKCNTDEFRVKRIVINLLGNAVKFTGNSGSITIDLSFLNNEPETSTSFIRISIRDTGIGIPIDKQDVIFEKFERLTSSYKSNNKGTGLGLFAVKTLVDELGGNVELISEPGKGATFICDIPMKKAAVGNHVDVLLDNEIKGKPKFAAMNSSPSLLLVEDAEIIQLATATILENLNCFVDVAATGKQAIKLCQANNYDLILMDIGLPDME